ncbi:MAG: DNA mismatch repair protein MutS [Planctomycetota bacterium]|nr:DNA mismatch repair protein MutS [Planctomycetota bacterium]
MAQAPTPMMRQYLDAKKACGDAILLFRMGDFYELFNDDAKIAAKTLGLALTTRDKGDNPTPMAGFPYHQLDGYLAKLIAAGMRAAVCEQVEDPKQAKGLVRREVTRVVSPGTVTDEALLDPRESNFLAAVIDAGEDGGGKDGKPSGMAWVELSTGRFIAAGFERHQLADQLARIAPAECLMAEEAHGVPEHLAERMMVTRRPAWAFSADAAREALAKHFGTAGLEGFGFTDDARDAQAIRAAGAILDYLSETQKSSLEHVDSLTPYRTTGTLEIDESSRRSLEISRTIRDGRREGSLLAVLDRAVTAMGSRMMADWVANPLVEVEQIENRYDAVEELLGESNLGDDLRQQLKKVYDVERLLARVATGRSSPRDLSFLGRTLRCLPELKAKLTARRSGLLNKLESEIDLSVELRGALDAALVDDCPLNARDGGFIRPGFREDLDALRELTSGGKQWIAEYQAAESERTGIANLKVGFNRVFGYYLEVTNTHHDKVPETYIRKQTLKNAERYITPELKEYEEKVLTADEKAKDLEYQVFVDLRDLVAAGRRRMQATAAVLAQIDVLVSLADLARQRNYCRAKMVDQPVLKIIDGRHPVLDVIEPDGTFVPNDTVAGMAKDDNEREGDATIDGNPVDENPIDDNSVDGEQDADTDVEGTILLITGPNMSGKSTYIRQVALITLMAQMGSFVPARRAVIGVADRIFARVGASDELSRGQSTFMVEMTETARILNTATQHSLVILDEIGRGTSTYDGISLAWAVVEHLNEHLHSRTLFATHYHELTDLAHSLSRVKNLNVAVREWQDEVVFLHKIVDGAADKSYGIHVARLAGVPREVVHRAKDILAQLEDEHLDATGHAKIALPEARESSSESTSAGEPKEIQLTLFGPSEHPLLDDVRKFDVNDTTPLEALRQISRWKKILDEEK